VQHPSVNPHPLWLSIDNPAPPRHRIVRNIERRFECPTGTDTGFTFSSLGLVRFGDFRGVDILSFLGVERVRSLLEGTVLDTMGNEVAVCLCPFNCVLIMVEVCLGLCTRGCGARVRVRLGERLEDG